MADYDRTILDFYQLQTPYPSEWPAEKDEAQQSGDEDSGPKRRLSRYQALERAAGDRRSSVVPGSEKGGLGNLVQKDEPDPLGTSESVVTKLENMSLPVQDDVRLRKSCKLLSQAAVTRTALLIHAARR